MKSILFFFIVLSNIFLPENHNQTNEKDWIGSYSFSARNREGLETNFNIQIIKFDNITVKYIGDGEKIQMYKNVKAPIYTKK